MAEPTEAEARELCCRLDLDERLEPMQYEIAVEAIARALRAARASSPSRCGSCDACNCESGDDVDGKCTRCGGFA